MMKISTMALGGLSAVTLASGFAVGEDDKLPESVLAKLGEQAVSSYNAQPYATPLPDHLWATVDDKSVVFLHFDKPLGEATRVLYVGYGIKGRWCAEDQESAEKLAGKGFTHFHRVAKVATPEAGHGGGKADEEGYWLKHVAVGPAFDMPWGEVKPGVTDDKFIPTAAPKCGS